jgi:hypothetical protein
MYKSKVIHSAGFIVLLLSLLTLQGAAQQFSATYNFSGVNTTSGRTDPTPVPVAEGLVFSSFQAIGEAPAPSANPNAGGRFSFTGWPAGATNGTDVFTGTINTGQYYQVTVSPQLNYRMSLDSITFTLQRSGTGIRQYAVRSDRDNFAANLAAVIEPANANLQVVNDNVLQVSDAATTLQDGSKIILSGMNDLEGPVTFRFYGWNAEAAGGTFSIDNVKFSGSATLAAGAPSLSTSVSSILFPATNIQTASGAITFTLQGENLAGPVNIAASGPFTISASQNTGYVTALVLNAADIAGGKNLFVKFSPVAPGSFSDSIVFSSAGAVPVKILLSGDGIDPSRLSFDFNNCSVLGAPGSGFITYSVTGAQQWACSNFGFGSNGVDVNGFSGSAQENEDWLISPPLQIGALNLPVLSFQSRGEFSGPSLQLLISTNYSGSGNPANATWTDMQANFPPANNTWTLTDGGNLSAYKSFPAVYIAFRYTSSPQLGAARWNIDNISITDRSTLLTVNPAGINFGEVSAGSSSPAAEVDVQAIGFGNITLTAPLGYQLSADNTTFSGQVQIAQASAEAGTSVYVRFSPLTKEIRRSGLIRITGTGLDSSLVQLTGSSYPSAETFDVAAYNLSFFGSNPTNNPTQQKIQTQINNIASVLEHIKMDVVAIEEMSNDTALTNLVNVVGGYSTVMSHRWSYSFEGPDPDFPPQKVGFIYNTSTMKLIESRVMFEGLYDSARYRQTNKLDDYPTGTASSFWSSGRLPFMATFDATINGVTKRVRLIVIHGKSASDAESYNRRVYDVKVLKDSLDAYYSNDNIILLGDYNDRVTGSIMTGAQSPFKPFADDTQDYSLLTLPLDQAGQVSFLGGSGLIDHIIISNELKDLNIINSTEIEDPRLYISGYNATTASDHLPVFTRFNLSAAAGPLPVTISRFTGRIEDKTVLLTWTTTQETNNSHFIIERSADGNTYEAIGRVTGSGNRSVPMNYRYTDAQPLESNYYRLKQVDYDGKSKSSKVVRVILRSAKKKTLHIYPNPVSSQMELEVDSPGSDYLARVTSADGRPLLQARGDIDQVKQQINGSLVKLEAGIYILELVNSNERYTVRFIKK